jgi:hypothetical protein
LRQRKREEIRSGWKSVNPRTPASDREREEERSGQKSTHKGRKSINPHQPMHTGRRQRKREEERFGTHAHRLATETERGREIRPEIHAHRPDLSLSNPEITLPIWFSFKQRKCKQKIKNQRLKRDKIYLEETHIFQSVSLSLSLSRFPSSQSLSFKLSLVLSRKETRIERTRIRRKRERRKESRDFSRPVSLFDSFPVSLSLSLSVLFLYEKGKKRIKKEEERKEKRRRRIRKRKA